MNRMGRLRAPAHRVLESASGARRREPPGAGAPVGGRRACAQAPRRPARRKTFAASSFSSLDLARRIARPQAQEPCVQPMEKNPDHRTRPPDDAVRTDSGIGMPKQMAVVVVVDIVDSVVLMRNHEAATVRRWAACVREARASILPRHRGEMVKSLGDGLMARFARVTDAIGAASELHAFLAQGNAGRPAGENLLLRAGINVAEAWTGRI